MSFFKGINKKKLKSIEKNKQKMNILVKKVFNELQKGCYKKKW
jgi:hypothetical protein